MVPSVTGDPFDVTTPQVHANDRVRLNHEGPLYVVYGTPNATLITLTLSAQTFSSSNSSGTSSSSSSSVSTYQPPWPLSTTTGTTAPANAPAVPYEVFPQPTRSATPPLQLPAGAIVDLQYSGIDIPSGTSSQGMNNWPYWFATMAAINNGYPVGAMIVFLPTGAVEGMYYPTQTQGASGTTLTGLNAPYPFRPTSLIYLHVGKFERLDRTVGTKPNVAPGGSTFLAKNPWASDGLYNWQDPDCMWVTVNPQNGYVTTKENATISSGFLNSNNAWSSSTTISVTGVNYPGVTGATASRWLARQAQQVSGR